ncbi:MAG TPA: ATP-binding cassette domain-containing protein, partial [Burkholderiales bacterium]|nr:ATP-binding cassette domain-containing protein [Burkholderiales bacterium]
FIGHANGLKDDLTAIENLRFALALAGTDVGTAALRDGLVRQGLGGVADLSVRLLSQGQKRRVALCRLLFSADKPLWVLDEPFAALDASSVERTAAVIVEHVRRGGMVVFTTHQDAGLADIRMHSLELGAG